MTLDLITMGRGITYFHVIIENFSCQVLICYFYQYSLKLSRF